MILEGKTALVTGANGGIGRRIVESMLAEGCSVYAHMRAEKSDFLLFAEELEKKYRKKVGLIYFDITDEADVRKNIQQLAREKVVPDILVNNAGVAHGGLLQMTPLAEIRRVFDINFFSVVQMTQLVSRLMARNGGGSIINLASVAGLDLAAGNCAYGTSKAAVIAFTKTISKELAAQNIRINAIAPGLTDTRMAEQMESRAGEEMVRQTAFKRLARPEEIADAAVFLASDKSSFITGQVLRVDGGM